MNALRIGGGLAALLAAALPALFLGCGSSSSSSTPPAVPTVAITGTSATAVNGPVTLTFTFSQAMSAFPASDVTVTGGTAAASTVLVDSTHYTLVVTPPANSTGTEMITVAAGGFTDAAGTASAAAASASQAFDTVAPTVAIGGTSATTATGPTTFTFTFSQPVSAFPASDVTVTGGTAAASTVMTDSTHWSLVVTPLANATGTEHVSVAAGAFMDAAGNLSTAAASASQAYDTVAAPVAPTVAITGTSATAATGPTTFTFTFSQPMTAFPAADVTVTGGTPAATVMVDATHFTLVVTPPANSTGTENVSVAIGAFTDTAGLSNLAAASASQAYNTSTAASYKVIDFNTTLAAGYAYTLTGFNGLDAAGAATLTTTVPAGAPSGSGPMFVEAINPAGTELTSGITMSVGGSLSVGAVPFFVGSATTPANTLMTAVVYAPAIGIPIDLKIENALNNGQSVETHTNTTAVGWQTLTFDFTKNNQPAPGGPTAALTAGFIYDKISIFPNFLQSPTTSQTFYVGAITFLGATAPAAAPLPPVAPLTTPTTAAPKPSVAAANAIALYNSTGTYADFPVNTWSASWGADTESLYAIPATGSTVLEYAGLQYAGVQIPNAIPGTTGFLDVSGMTTMHVDLWTSNGTQFGIQLVSFVGGAGAATGIKQILYTSSTITQKSWISLEIPLSSFAQFSGASDLTSLGQILGLDYTGSTENGTFYLDNVYFHK